MNEPLCVTNSLCYLRVHLRLRPQLEKSPVALPKIDKLSYNQLIELKDTIEATIAQRRADEQAALKEKMAEMAAEAGFDLEDVLPAKRGGKGKKGGTVAPKYRNPKDTSQTWTGRGRQPKWLVAELEKGRKLESFLIQ
jgi:DNA-binding protein H-NS